MDAGDRIHCPGNNHKRLVGSDDCSIDLSSGDAVAASGSGLARLITIPANFEQILDDENTRERRGRLLVLPSNRLPPKSLENGAH
jgi:hypothetical protein